MHGFLQSELLHPKLLVVPGIEEHCGITLSVSTHVSIDGTAISTYPPHTVTMKSIAFG